MAYRRKVNIGASWHRGLIRNKTRDQTALTPILVRSGSRLTPQCAASGLSPWRSSPQPSAFPSLLKTAIDAPYRRHGCYPGNLAAFWTGVRIPSPPPQRTVTCGALRWGCIGFDRACKGAQATRQAIDVNEANSINANDERFALAA